MSMLSTIEIQECSKCEDRTPQRRLRSGVAASLILTPVLLAIGAGLCFAATFSAAAALCLTGVLLTVAFAMSVLRRPRCERCHGREWMAHHPTGEGARKFIYFYNVLGQSLVLPRRR